MPLPFRAPLVALALGLSLVTTAAQAQSAGAAAGPRLEQSRAGVRTATSPSIAMVALADQAPRLFPQPEITRRRGVPQMIIGGAALVGGAIVGDDAGTIIMIGGLGYGLYGLYLYLQ